MPRVERHATVTWEGNVARGRGVIHAGTGAFTGLEYSLPVRIGKGTEGKTSPEELLAAAHAGCYAMSLASELTAAGTPPERLDVTATCTLDEVEGQGHRIVAMDVEARTRAPGIDEESLRRAAQVAEEGCSISALVRATARVTVSAELEQV